MNKSETIGKLSEALAKAQAVIEGAKKDSANPYFKSKYADLASVWDACRKPLTDNGLSVIQTGLFDTTNPDMVIIETTLSHASGEWVSGIMAAKPVKTDPQSIGSCVTYLRRYSLSAIAGVSPEDDDANTASGNTSVTPKKWTPSVKEPLPRVDGMGEDLPDVPEVDTNPEDTLTVEHPLYKEIWQKIKDTPELDHEEFVAFLISYKSGVDGQGHPRRPLLTLPEFTTMKVSDAEYLVKNWNRCYAMFLKSKIEK